MTTVIMMLMALGWSALAIERRHGVLVGVALKVNTAARETFEHSYFSFPYQVVNGASLHDVNGMFGSVGQRVKRYCHRAPKMPFMDLKAGSEVAVHYTAKGTEETAEEIDHHWQRWTEGHGSRGHPSEPSMAPTRLIG